MQMIMMTFRSSLKDVVVNWLEAENLFFTFVEEAHGKGKTGDDSMYGGGMNTMLFAGVQNEQLNDFRERIHNWQRQFTGDAAIHVFALPCLQWF